MRDQAADLRYGLTVLGQSCCEPPAQNGSFLAEMRPRLCGSIDLAAQADLLGQTGDESSTNGGTDAVLLVRV